ncbi:hypothetical protein ACFSTC_51080 [Nonomuraea ferruginea]
MFTHSVVDALICRTSAPPVRPVKSPTEQAAALRVLAAQLVVVAAERLLGRGQRRPVLDGQGFLPYVVVDGRRRGRGRMAVRP